MNQVNLIGNFTKEFAYSHTTNNVSFYSSILSVSRLSSVIDDILIISPIIPEELNNNYYIHGEIRVFNRHGKSKYYVYPDFMYQVDEPHQNSVELIGSVETVSDKRETPLGSHIKDVMLKVENEHKSIYIPLIFWNGLSNTEFLKGQDIHIKGRLQSRVYTKNDISRQILEVSVNELI